MPDLAQCIRDFLAAPAFGVAGASTNREKYGNKVLRCYLQHGRRAFGINPRATEIEGVPCYPDLASLPAEVSALSLITPPKISEALIEACADSRIRRVWFQPGAESRLAVQRAEALGLEPIAGGACLLVVLGFRE
jgi:predicted CoA-binding protein